MANGKPDTADAQKNALNVNRGYADYEENDIRRGVLRAFSGYKHWGLGDDAAATLTLAHIIDENHHDS